MLKLNQVKLLKDQFLISEYPVQVSPTTEGGVHKAQEVIDLEVQKQFIRVGKVIKTGIISDELRDQLSLSYSPTTGKLKELTQKQLNIENDTDIIVSLFEPLETILNTSDIIYSANSSDPFDLPIEGYKNLRLIRGYYVLGFITPDQEEIV